ncbi:MAG: formate--tetrahydrofolate ligase, partial [Bacteroidetes bacterium]
ELIRKHCESMGVAVEVAEVWAKGGEGAQALAERLSQVLEQSTDHTFRPLYDWTLPVPEKVEIIATKIYGARAIDYTAQAKRDLRKIDKLGLNELPVCIAKTQKSLSDNPKLLGRPKDFVVTVREIEIAAGAGFLIPITGDIMRMPGLPATPAAEGIDINEAGEITGLF